MRSRLAALPCVLLVLSARAHAVSQSEGQRACIAALDRAGVEIARAQATLTTTCLDPATADAAACLAGDTAPAVVAARQATFAAAVASCADMPDFGLAQTVDQGVNAAAVIHMRGLVIDALGSSPGGALIDDAIDHRGRRCQGSVVQGTGSVATAFLTAFQKCVSKALARGADAEDDLVVCVRAAKGKAGKARKRLVAAARKGCRRTDVATAFPGVCTGSGTTGSLGRCLGARALCRACRAANAMNALAADCDLLDDGAGNDSCTFRVTLSGDAFPFVGGATNPIEGADVSLLELPDRHVTTGPDGHFVFDDLEEGSDVTVVLAHPDYHPIQTGTFRLGPDGIDRVTFQAVTPLIYDALATLLAVTPDEATRCQMVTTVTRVGRSLYDPGAHGEDGVTVTLDPPLPADQGPIYFNSSVLPDRTLVQTSDDGGVLFIQVPPGDYVWTARKAGAVFSRVRMKCRVGVLVNASPPRGLQRH